TAAAIEQALQNDEPLQLTAAQRAAVLRAAEAKASSVSVWLRPRWAWSAAVAVLALAIIPVTLLWPSRSARLAQMAKVEPFAVPAASIASTPSASAPAPTITVQPVSPVLPVQNARVVDGLFGSPAGRNESRARAALEAARERYLDGLR